jgi:hypothetical protein
LEKTIPAKPCGICGSMTAIQKGSSTAREKFKYRHPSQLGNLENTDLPRANDIHMLYEQAG